MISPQWPLDEQIDFESIHSHTQSEFVICKVFVAPNFSSTKNKKSQKKAELLFWKGAYREASVLFENLSKLKKMGPSQRCDLLEAHVHCLLKLGEFGEALAVVELMVRVFLSWCISLIRNPFLPFFFANQTIEQFSFVSITNFGDVNSGVSKWQRQERPRDLSVLVLCAKCQDAAGLLDGAVSAWGEVYILFYFPCI